MSATNQTQHNSKGGFEDSSVEPGVWRYVKATRASVIVDADEYFRVMQEAMLKAQQRILLIGWDFDTRIHLARGRKWYGRRGQGRYPSRLGSFILWLNRHRSDLDICILKWSYGFLRFASRGCMLLDMVRWFPHKRIDLKFDTSHPIGCSHHQKIAVLDNHLAVCGGIDMAAQRWDMRAHIENDARRKNPRGSYYKPWHDATMMMEGEAARALEQLGRDRWKNAGGAPLEEITPSDRSIWPEALTVQFTDVEIGIARTRSEYDDREAVNEVEQLFVRHIARAKKFIYAESQYFASRIVAECIAKRMSEPNPPEIIIVNPATADGWLEQQAMDNARARLIRSISKNDRKGRFHVYAPFTGEEAIYVHSKLMIVDDEVLRIGSANLNNRSMGLDSECDVFIDADRPGNEHVGPNIAKLRYSLLAEHCGLDESDVPGLIEHYGSMASMIRHCPASSRQLRTLDLPELNDTERAMADNEILDPERPDQMFAPFNRRTGLFRKGSRLRRPLAFFRRKLKK